MLLNELESRCCWRDGLVAYCEGGMLFDPSSDRMILIDKLPVYCSACNGRGFILSRQGERFIEMIWRHLAPKVYETAKEVAQQVLNSQPDDEDPDYS